MDSTKEEKRNFARIVSISSESEIMEPDSLSMEIIQQVSKHKNTFSFRNCST